MRLTAREYQCVEMVAQSMENAEIGERLGIAESTVRHLLSTAYLRTGARNRVELAVMFVRGQIAGPDLREVA